MEDDEEEDDDVYPPPLTVMVTGHDLLPSDFLILICDLGLWSPGDPRYILYSS
jgi:hypothetical protein